MKTLFVVLVLTVAVSVWFTMQRTAMHTVGQHPSTAYCQIVKAVGYPMFQQGERWRCDMEIDGIAG